MFDMLLLVVYQHTLKKLFNLSESKTLTSIGGRKRINLNNKHLDKKSEPFNLSNTGRKK